MNPEDRPRLTNYKGIIIKLLITATLLYLLMNKMELPDVVWSVSQLDSGFLALAMGLTVGSIILSAYKWQLLLKARGWVISLNALTKYYFIGLFMNNFLPSSIGGDLMRIYKVGKRIGNSYEAAASVIVERLLATVGIVVPTVIALVPNLPLLGIFLFPVVAFLIICLSLIYLIVNPAILKPLSRIPGKWWQSAVAKLGELNCILQGYRAKPLAVFKVMVYSVLFQMVVVLINYCLLRAMGVNYVSLRQCTLMIPIISAVSMLPISINGLGVREAAYVLLFSRVGMSSTQSITLSLLFFVVVSIASLIGGLLFVLEKEKQEYAVAREA